jgi:hypothetical protein
MPIGYSIDQARQLVVSSVRPTLTSKEVAEFCQRLSKDARFCPTFRQIHEVHKGALSSMQYSEMSMLEVHDPFSKESVRAIVVYADEDYGMARTYELIRRGNVHLCQSLDEAARLLDLDRDFLSSLKLRNKRTQEVAPKLAQSNAEPMLVYKLSDDSVFRCSECEREVASIGSARYIAVSRVLELVAAFQEHVRRHHGDPGDKDSDD